MSKQIEKNEALRLRKQGLTYNEIREKIKVSKSTLSLWLRSVGLAKRHTRRISEKQRQTQKRAVEKWHTQRVEKTRSIKEQAYGEIGPLTKRELWFIGIALYWAEGSKEHEHGTRVQLSNSDPHMLLLFKKWACEYLKAEEDDFDYTLYIHERARNISGAVGYWADFLSIEPHQISLVFKKHNPSPKRKNIGVNYRGLVRLTIRRSTDLNRRISGWIDGIVSASRIAGE